MVTKHFRTFENVVLTLYLAMFIKLEREERVEFRKILCVAQCRQKWNAPAQTYSVSNVSLLSDQWRLFSNSHGKWLKLGFILAICNLRHMSSVRNKGLYRAPVKVETAKNAAFNVLSRLQLNINVEKAL